MTWTRFSARTPRAGSAAGSQTSAPSSAPPPMSPNPPGPDRDAPKAPAKAQHPATQSRRNQHPGQAKARKTAGQRLKRKHREVDPKLLTRDISGAIATGQVGLIGDACAGAFAGGLWRWQF
jgi:hypothetical protein